MRRTALFAAIALLLPALPGPAVLGAAEALPLVVIVTTGGTIAEKNDAKTGAAVPEVNGKDLIAAVPGLEKEARLRVREFCNIDSSHMTPEIWARLSRTVEGILKEPEVAGVVVTHGTDTMAEGAFFLDLTLDSDKPVVFTGAMRNASSASPDGPANIRNAVLQAASPRARGWGVTVTLNQYVCSARYARKTHTSNAMTFTCGQQGFLGYILEGEVLRWNTRPDSPRVALPQKLSRVALLSTFAGDDGSFVRAAADQGFEGIVIEALGAGNVNADVAAALRYAMGKGACAVITSRVPQGPVFPAYGDTGGGEDLQKAGALLGGDIPGPKARLLLMLALPQVHDKNKLAELFQ